MTPPKRRITKPTNTQMNYLTSYMLEHPNFARNARAKADNNCNAIWDKLTASLNARGPPIRTVDRWKKAWTDYKCAIRKTSANRSGILSSTQDQIAAIIGSDRRKDVYRQDSADDDDEEDELLHAITLMQKRHKKPSAPQTNNDAVEKCGDDANFEMPFSLEPVVEVVKGEIEDDEEEFDDEGEGVDVADEIPMEYDGDDGGGGLNSSDRSWGYNGRAEEEVEEEDERAERRHLEMMEAVKMTNATLAKINDTLLKLVDAVASNRKT